VGGNFTRLSQRAYLEAGWDQRVGDGFLQGAHHVDLGETTAFMETVLLQE
jgi:hypothetical protein